MKDIVKSPWSLVGILIGELVRSARGGISKEEAEELLGHLADIIADVSIQIGAQY
jgi:hypothetical protein